MRTTLYERFGKRALDLVLGALMAVFFLPLGLLIALAIKLDSPGPVLYMQPRAGRFGKPFRLVKFRSMIVGAEQMGAGMLVEKDDPRITRVGRWLRRFSLDEIPQLLNVLAGQMSLVGPRPAPLYQVAQYDSRQRQRLRVRPGLTGWAQIRGRNENDWGRRIELDLEYLRRLSFFMDARILLGTVPKVLAGSGLFAEREYWTRASPSPGHEPPARAPDGSPQKGARR